MNPSLGSVAPTRIEAHIERGVALRGRVWAAERPRALIGIVHGICEHSGRYAALASDLVDAGFTVSALDWPGHGESPGTRGDARSWVWMRDALIPALLTATQGMPDQPQNLPCVVLGHSMGGVMALDYALAQPHTIAAVVASSPALKPPMPPWWKLALANVALTMAPSVGFATGMDTGGISRDAEVNRLREADKLVHNVISPRLYHGYNEARQRVQREARRLSIPALIMAGTGDRIVHSSGAKEFVAAAPRERARLILYDGAYHEIFNDLGREGPVRDLIEWLDAPQRLEKRSTS